MPQPPRPLTPWLDMPSLFGAELRQWRQRRGLTQDELGRAIHISGDMISKIEKAVRRPQMRFAQACDQILETGGALTRIIALMEHQRSEAAMATEGEPAAAAGAVPAIVAEDVDSCPPEVDNSDCGSRQASAPGATISLGIDDERQMWEMIGRRALLLASTTAAMTLTASGSETVSDASTDPSAFAAVLKANWPGSRILRSEADILNRAGTLHLPGGRSFAGATTGLELRSAAHVAGFFVYLDGEPERERGSLFPGHHLVFAELRSPDSLSYFAMDRSAIHGTCTSAAPERRMAIPVAYELDNLTYAGLWALTNMDEQLLLDDTVLDQAYKRSRQGLWTARVEVFREEVPDLGGVSQMWLGSQFCAHHITAHLQTLNEVPAFWTREQRGEEASSWLLFKHKLDYLRTTTTAYRESSTRPVRAFCIPETEVIQSAPTERILLLLSAALMEAHGVTIQILSDSGYSQVPGFVHADASPSLIATWARADEVWHVDVTTKNAHRRELADTLRAASSSSVVEALTPARRLETFTHYLGLDWRWLRRRCAQMAHAGWSGLIQPRSRLLSVAGLDLACRFLARM